MNERVVKCPTCKKCFNFYSSEFRPFCCEKCRLIDLGQWLNESYSIAVANLSEEEEESVEVKTETSVDQE